MGQIIFWASWNEWSLPSPLPHVFQTSDLCCAWSRGTSCLFRLTFSFLSGWFSVSGSPWSHMEGLTPWCLLCPSVSISAPFWEKYMPSHPPHLHGFYPPSLRTTPNPSLSQPFTPTGSPDFLHTTFHWKLHQYFKLKTSTRNATLLLSLLPPW